MFNKQIFYYFYNNNIKLVLFCLTIFNIEIVLCIAIYLMYFSFWQFCFIKNIQLNKSLKLKINAKICDYSENQQDSLPKIVKIVQISMNCFHMNWQP